MKINLSVTALLGMLAIILGAFGAHALKNHLDAAALTSFETGVRYQMYHVLALLFVNIYPGFTARTKNTISLLFFAGIVFFSGSIYAITALGVNAGSIWFITPLGGLLFIIGWALLFYKFLKKTD